MIRVTWQRARFLTLFWALWCTFAIAQNTTDATKNYHDLKPGVPVSFAKQVAPILQAKCVGCHSQTSSMGGLVLSDFASLMKGGSHGPAVVPGNGKDSRMVQMLEGNVQPRMPMGAQLDPLEIASIKLWIDQGAKLDQDPGQLQALREPEIPKIAPAPVSSQAGAVAFSPDGNMIAVGGYGGVRLLDARTRQPMGQLTGLTEAVRTLSFSPDGRYLAAGAGRPAQHGEIKVWQTGDSFWTRPALHSTPTHRDCVYALAFSPDSKSLASASYDQMIYLWDPATGKQIKPLKEHTDAVFDLAFSPDGQWLASGGADRTVKLWDVASGKRIFTLGSATEGVNTVAFHPHGTLLAASGFDCTIRVWDLSGKGDPTEVHAVIAHDQPVLRIAYSPDGRWLATTGWDKLVKIWETKTMTEIRTIPGQSDWVLSMSFSPDGKQLLFGRYDGSVSVYETATYQRIGNLLEGQSPQHAAR